MTIPPRRRDHARPISAASRMRSVRGGRRRGGWGGPSFVWIAVVTIALGSLATIAILLGSPKSPTSGLLGSPGGSPGSSAGIAGTSSAPSDLPSGSGPLNSFGSTGPGASSSANGPVGTVPIVPVVDFRSALLSVGVVDVRAILNGHQATFKSLELVSTEADPILAAIGVDRPDVAARLILAASVAVIDKDLAAHSDRLAFIRADAVTPAVRALAWGSRTLFGVDRVKSAAAWQLNAALPTTIGTAPAFNPAAVWTMVAGGDIMLDRGVAKAVTVQKRGVDFPFSGGTARITGRHCCSSLGWPTVVAVRTGNAGAVRSLLKSADLAVANFENPAPDNFKYHTQGTVFSANPRLIAGLKDAGIDYVSLGNNHIGDAGPVGLLQTLANLDKYGIRHSGAGRNLAAARTPAIMTVDGVKVAILSYDTIAKYYAAGTNKAGSAQLTAANVKVDVAAARKAGAQIVIVYPHWGTEYSPRPFSAEQSLAHAVIDAGADMVIGNHAHWVGAMEIYKGRPIWYALGNFVFDQIWSEPTSEGLLLQLTFRGTNLVQVRLQPTVILDGAQPNLLDPAKDGRVVLGQLYDASGKMLTW
ncbi:MAG TPA: CapA family protein [Verrucomicrobiae bacterium]|nr:CapA family protein [Verrucomicrobiae bacterium]